MSDILIDPAEIGKMVSGLNKPDSDGKIYGIVISCDTPNTYKKVYPENGTDFKLEELYGYVGSPIEMLRMNNGKTMILNEEGKLKGLPVNMAATFIAKVMPHDVIVGDALICGANTVL